MGRPSKLTPEVTKRLTEAIRAGNYTEKTVEDRVSSFIGLIIAVLTIYLCIFVLRMI